MTWELGAFLSRRDDLAGAVDQAKALRHFELKAQDGVNEGPAADQSLFGVVAVEQAVEHLHIVDPRQAGIVSS